MEDQVTEIYVENIRKTLVSDVQMDPFIDRKENSDAIPKVTIIDQYDPNYPVSKGKKPL